MKLPGDIRAQLEQRGILSAADARQVAISLAVAGVTRLPGKSPRRYTVSKAGRPLLSVKVLSPGWPFAPADIAATQRLYAGRSSFKVPELIDHFSNDQGHFFVEQYLPAAASLTELVQRGETSAAQALDVVKGILVDIWESGDQPTAEFIAAEMGRYREYFRHFVQPGSLGEALFDHISSVVDAAAPGLRRVMCSGDIIERNIVQLNGAWYLVDFEFSHPTLFLFQQGYRNILYSSFAGDLPLGALCPFLNVPSAVAILLSLAWEANLYSNVVDARARIQEHDRLRRRFWGILGAGLAGHLDRKPFLIGDLLRGLEADVSRDPKAWAARDSEPAATLGSEVGGLLGQREAVRAEVVSLREKLEGREQRIEILGNQVGSLTAEVEAGRADLERRIVELRDLHAELGVRQDEITRLHLELAASQVRRESAATAAPARPRFWRLAGVPRFWSRIAWAARALVHFVHATRAIRNSGLFDEQYYLDSYPDVAKAGTPALFHFIWRGAAERRNPNRWFETGFYVDSNPDVAAAGLNPLLHFIRRGAREGRSPNAALAAVPHAAGGSDGARSGYESLVDPAEAVVNASGGVDADHSDREVAIEPTGVPEGIGGEPGAVPDGTSSKVKLIAFYLPQFHPIPENDLAWGQGFTEWTYVAKAAPLFKSHEQPHLPLDLGFYDLRLAEVREAQADMARSYGIYGFCYYYYWFDGHRLLNRPLDDVLESGRPEFPFCICWANEPWSRKWDGSEHEVIVNQEYRDGFAEHFIKEALPILRDPRYIRIGGRPLLAVYRIGHLPDPAQVAETWRQVCRDEGLGEICLAAVGSFGLGDPRPFGFDVKIEFPPHNLTPTPTVGDTVEDLHSGFEGAILDYRICAATEMRRSQDSPTFRGVMPRWDNSPRAKHRALVFHHSSPTAYQGWLRALLLQATEAAEPFSDFVFINAWNEWGEGAHLEPSTFHGKAYLEATIAALRSVGPELTAAERLRAAYCYLFDGGTPFRSQDEPPEISIIIPVFNKVELTLDCLHSLYVQRSKWNCEIIVVDDGSTDLTETLLSSMCDIVYVRREENAGFVGACNLGAKHARGGFLVFLNNDTTVREGWVDALRDTFREWPRAGLVGSKLVFPSGRLQECGSLVYRDGSAANYGRDGDPGDPRYCFVRETDYVSGAAMMIPRDLFACLGGFDERYAPAYYEDTDLALRVREMSLQVLVNPHAVVVHREGGTAGTDLGHGVKRYQVINQAKFFERWRGVLQSHPERESAPEPRSRFSRILVVDWIVPRPDRDSASVRMTALLRILRELEFEVTFAAHDLSYDARYARELERIGIEVLRGPYVDSLLTYLRNEGDAFAYVILSRRDVAQSCMDTVKECCPGAKVIFDTVDLHFIREERGRRLGGPSRNGDDLEGSRTLELDLVRRADTTLVVSETEQTLLSEMFPSHDIRVVSNIHTVEPTWRGFEGRSGLLFVGFFLHVPNVDAVRWFVQEVLPLLTANDSQLMLHVVGSNPPDAVLRLASSVVQVHGFVPDLRPLFERCRVFVAPLRYGAGVKGKIGQAMALGLPCVTTSIGAEGMCIEDGIEALVADEAVAFAEKVHRLYTDRDLWQKIRDGGVARIGAHFSPDVARRELVKLLTPEPALRRGVG